MTSNTTTPGAPGAPITQATPTPVAPRPLLVLLVEDHPVNQMLATTLLKKWGHTVVLAQNGQEAVDLFPHSPWDVVLMDMQMPVMDGLLATQALRTLPGKEDLTIIALTANAFADDRERCLNAGMNDFIAKPFDPDEVFEKLVRWFGATNR